MAPAASRRRIKRAATAGVVSAPPYLTRRIPVYELLDEESLVRLEAHADWLLAEIGIPTAKASLDRSRQKSLNRWQGLSGRRRKI